MATDNALAQSSTHTADRAGACVSVYMACRAGGMLYKVGPGRAPQKALVRVLASRNYGLIRERRWLILSFKDNNFMIILPSSDNSIIIFKADVNFVSVKKLCQGLLHKDLWENFLKEPETQSAKYIRSQTDRPTVISVYAESIEWFTEDQVFLRSFDSASHPPTTTLSILEKSENIVQKASKKSK
jgi:hypothetical protein